MSKPKKPWWGFIRNIIKTYPNNEQPEANEAVQEAVAYTLTLENGQDRMKVVELYLMKRTHTIHGAALKTYYSEAAVKKYSQQFIREVAKRFKSNGLY